MTKKIYEVDIIWQNMNDDSMDHIHTYTLGNQMSEDGMDWQVKEIIVHARDLEDYRYCEDCDTVFDYWKYDSMADTGHDGCKVRLLTVEEFSEAIRECMESGCIE